MTEMGEISIQHLFADLEDPRQASKVKHSVQDIVVLGILAVISNAQSWLEIAAFGQAKEAWLKQYLVLENGIPSHDTIQRVFQLLNPDDLMSRFVTWTKQVMIETQGHQIAIDGKTMRGSYDATRDQKALHLVRAWATEQGLVLGQQRVEVKENEIVAIPKLLETLVVKGCIVTLDAMGCQTAIASQIRQAGGDYVLALKENHPHLYQHATDYFQHALQTDFRFLADHDYARTINKGHGRVETRECWLIRDTAAMPQFRQDYGWVDLKAIVMVRRQRQTPTGSSQVIAYYITSLSSGADVILQAIRRHWAIENECHWVLDVIFDEDRSRIRLGDSPQNFAIIRNIALTVLKQDPSKGSLKGKRFKAALNDDFRLQLVTNLHA
ncbi:MAG: ISAs1 family transposase [Spirulinaceae cyanobacterium RM2_2_10]|nr:ISAs1 family transposase [Spirulinaceae cyanobacterium RM2_2_10]